MYKTKDLLDLSKTLAQPLLEEVEYPWEVLGKISEFIKEVGETLPAEEYDRVGEDVWIAKDAEVYETAYIKGPCIIGHNTEVRHCAFIRGSALIGNNCVIGNSVEVKNAIIFDNVQVPHYNYVGDSILGYKSHMGAGAVTSNVKSDRTLVKVRENGETVETGLKKFGAILGDYVEVGCNSVLNPGTVIGRHSSVYPTSGVRGVVPENSIYKGENNIVKKV